ncbi:MAG TPA: hypothetical protein VHO24_18125 [Opitutaceae bacterium]|nr:hypothetical protein [Opitutaceae bacterium]
MITTKDQFDAAAEWLLAHLAAWEVLRRGFGTVEPPEDKQARVEMVAAFLRYDFWNRPDGSLPRLGEPFVIPIPER